MDQRIDACAADPDAGIGRVQPRQAWRRPLLAQPAHARSVEKARRGEGQRRPRAVGHLSLAMREGAQPTDDMDAPRHAGQRTCGCARQHRAKPDEVQNVGPRRGEGGLQLPRPSAQGGRACGPGLPRQADDPRPGLLDGLLRPQSAAMTVGLRPSSAAARRMGRW